MLLNLFVDRFALRYHLERRPFEVLALVRARADERLESGLRSPTVDCEPWAAAVARGEPANRPPPRDGRPSCALRLTRVDLEFRVTGAGVDSSELLSVLDEYARVVAGVSSMPVVERANLNRFDVDLMWSMDDDGPRKAPLFADALRDQLGLKFEKRSEMLDVMVIDSIRPPTPN